MAKKKTAKKEEPVTADVEIVEEPVTADVEIVEEYDATRYTPWIPGNMPVGGKSNSTEQLNDHPTEHNHSAEAISDIVDRFADLRLYVPAANSCGVDGNLTVDNRIFASGLTIKKDSFDQLEFDRTANSSVDHTVKIGPSYSTVDGQKITSFLMQINDKNLLRVRENETSELMGSLKVQSDLQVDGQTKAQNGTKTAPAYSFTSDTKAGLYRKSSNTIEFVANGKRLLQMGIDSSEYTGAWMPTISTRTVTTPGNVYIDTNVAQEGALYRSTASRAAMQEIEAVNLDATNSVYDLAPIWFRSKCEGDNLEHSHYGLAAEDCAAVDPRLAIMATDADGVETADNVNTNAVIALLVSAVQEQRATISDLTARVEALENA